MPLRRGAAGHYSRVGSSSTLVAAVAAAASTPDGDHRSKAPRMDQEVEVNDTGLGGGLLDY